ncbi:MAG: DUF1446 domain-containing protein [Gammaproteobacteria bacterium]|nr:DUF1446 domain-containing protein [Gammaproteobacteria bacterium]
MIQARSLRIGGCSGFWGESPHAARQLLESGNVHVLVFDYLAEVTMSIMARARASDPSLGFARDFVTEVLKPNLSAIASQRTKVIANAGGVNSRACAELVRELINEAGLELKVAVVSGDDLLSRANDFAENDVKEMFSSERFPDPCRVASINAYLGAFPIAAALAAGADIVITGRCADSAVTLGACVHHFGWDYADLDKLAGGSLAGHVLECSTQATGGNFTDWQDVADTMADIGYPIAEVSADGGFVVTKPQNTGGTVTVGTVSEQILYEIGDPQAYALPDVTCDFSGACIEQVGTNRVSVSGARGATPPSHYKVSATYADGFRGGQLLFFYGDNASQKAQAYADAVVTRSKQRLQASGLEPFSEIGIETFGDESHYGAARRVAGSREITLKIAAKHQRKEGIALLLAETIGMGLGAPPGLALFQGGRPKPSPVVRLFSFLVPKNEIAVEVSVDDQPVELPIPESVPTRSFERPSVPAIDPSEANAKVRLYELAWGRSGDKGNNANIGIIARKPEYLPWIWNAITEECVAERFSHFLEGPVERFLLPGPNAINFLLHDVLGGGGIASLRNDPQGKGYAQLLLDAEVPIPDFLLES